jgi:hypothetical protein
LEDTVEKSFAHERNFSAPLARPARGNVSNHNDSHRKPSCLPYRRLAAVEAMQKKLLRDFRGDSIFDFFNSIALF